MDNKPVIIVSGLARCGTSLTMQMLRAAGMRCAGEPPAFEPPETNTVLGSPDAAWLRQFEAVKIIDPHHAEIPEIDGRILWLDRNPVQQAMSQLKFLRCVAGIVAPSGSAARVRKSLIADRPKAIMAFRGMPMLFLKFEGAIRNPEAFAESIAGFLSPWYSLDTAGMASRVRARRNGSMCEPGVDMEMVLIGAHAETRGAR